MERTDSLKEFLGTDGRYYLKRDDGENYFVFKDEKTYKGFDKSILSMPAIPMDLFTSSGLLDNDYPRDYALSRSKLNACYKYRLMIKGKRKDFLVSFNGAILDPTILGSRQIRGMCFNEFCKRIKEKNSGEELTIKKKVHVLS